MMTSSLSAQSGVALRPKLGMALSQPAKVPARGRRVAAQALETQIVISGATAASLALGRFVFLPFQRDNVNRQGIGEALEAATEANYISTLRRSALQLI